MSNKTEQLVKIVVIGPESTGKSTLCQSLASHFQTLWCREYAREYLIEHGTDYTFDDLQTIANGQLHLEEKAIAEVLQLNTEQQQSNKPLLIIDTDMQVMKVWCEFVFGKCHQQILDSIIVRKYDGYLICKPDLPWVKDELREYPDLETRELLYHIYKDILINQSLPWYEVHGKDPERTSGAIHWIRETFQIKAKY